MSYRPQFQGYSAPLRTKPEWQVPWLVFQGGNMRQRTGSLTGGGQIYSVELGAFAPNLSNAYSNAVLSVVGGGQINARPSWLQALLGGASGNGS